MKPPEIHPAIRQNRLAYSRIVSEWQTRQTIEFDGAFHEQCRMEFLRHLSGNRILDIGCGLGLDSLAFAQSGLSVVAADLTIEFLPLVRSRHPSLSVVAADMTQSCFGTATFDGIFAFASFLHVPAPLAKQTLAGFAQILAPGGVLFLHHVKAGGGRKAYRINDLLIPSNPALCFCQGEDELVSLLSTQGLDVISLTRHQPPRPPSEIAIRCGLVPYQVTARKASEIQMRG
jgi:SAM-dependent methyltransferase